MSTSEVVIRFGQLQLFRTRRLLVDGEVPVRIGSRALDLLLALLDKAPEVVTRDALVAQVWPRTVVEETSLRVHIGALRKVLGDGQAGNRFIVNVPGVGYAFVAPLSIEPVASDTAEPRAEASQAPASTLPARLTRTIGREEIIHAVSSTLSQHRITTIVGPGGIGKTTASLAVAEQVSGRHRDGAYFVDLAVLSDPGLVSSAVASALRLSFGSGDTPQTLAKRAGDRHALVVLDNCEHVIDSAREVAVSLAEFAPGVTVLATSREPLGAPGESVHRLPPLRSPPLRASSRTALSAQEAASYSAVQLLVERITSNIDRFELSDDDAPLAAELCRRLDGIPLAIELAAARVAFFGLHGLLARLNDRLNILTNGFRTVLPRHQTLRALHDWSYELLPEENRLTLRLLSVFAGSFTEEAALAVIAEDRSKRAPELANMYDLVGKSLLSADWHGDSIRMRMLETTRSYAGEKLREQPLERAAAHRRHAEYLTATLDRANAEWNTDTRATWVELHAWLIDEVRVALDWAFGPDGDAVLAATLTRASIQLGQQLSLMDELRSRIEAALYALQGVDAPTLEMELSIALGNMLGHTLALQSDIDQMARRATEAAARTDSSGAGWQSCYGMWVGNFGLGNYPLARAAADRMRLEAERVGDPSGRVISMRMLAQTMHFQGEHGASRQVAEHVLANAEAALRIGSILDPVDRRLSMRIVLSRIAWLAGETEESLQYVAECLQLAQGEIAYAQCQAYAMAAIPIAMWRGDRPTALVHLDQLKVVAHNSGLSYWMQWVEAYGGLLQGNRPTVLTAARGKLRDHLITLSHHYVDEPSLVRARSGTVGWCAAEIIRARASRSLAVSPSAPIEPALAEFAEARDLALRQGALSWALRAVTSRARLLRAQGRRQQAEDELLAIVDRLPAGASGSDVDTARNLLNRQDEPDAARHRRQADRESRTLP